MKNYKLLSQEEYNGLPFSLEDAIQRHVNREETRWYEDKPIAIPAVVERKVEHGKVFWKMFFRQVLP